MNRYFEKGSERLLRARGWFCSSTAATTLLLLVQTAMAAAPAAPSHVTTADVLAAMTRQHLPIDDVQVTFPAAIAATIDAPALEVGQVVMRDARSASLRLACVTRRECPSFYVLVRWPKPPGSLALQGSKASPLSVVHTPTQALHAGARVTLLIDQEKVHIRLPVICAQNGAVGDRIRVTTMNRRQIYEAVVLTETEVQGSL